MDQSQREKLAADLPAVLTEAANHMEAMSRNQVALEKRASDAEHELRVMKLARRMEERGVHSTLSFEEKVAELRGAHSEKLAAMENGLEFAARGFNLGTAKEPEVSNGSSADQIDSWIMGNHAFGS